MKEAGGIRAPISKGVFSREDIVSDLVGMRKETATLHRSDDEITPSKSIGMTLIGLVGAGLAYKGRLTPAGSRRLCG